MEYLPEVSDDFINKTDLSNAYVSQMFKLVF